MTPRALHHPLATFPTRTSRRPRAASGIASPWFLPGMVTLVLALVSVMAVVHRAEAKDRALRQDGVQVERGDRIEKEAPPEDRLKMEE